VLDIPSWMEYNGRLPAINGYPGQSMNVVLWTLRYEWLFYLILPLLALFAQKRLFPLLFIALLGCYYYSKHIAIVSYYSVILNMLAGMTAAWVMSGRMPTQWLASKTVTIGIFLLVLISPYLKLPEPYGEEQTLLLFAIFLPIAAGNTLFGLLSVKPLRLLGMISYSIYLLHFTMKTLNRSIGVSNLSEIQFWLLFMAMAALVTGLCMLTYRWIEYPDIRRKEKQYPAL
jgi:peptidoglycan/LPS O-acetylase OafA/YrhL